MAKIDSEVTVTFRVTTSLWDVIKFRLMGKRAKDELFEKLKHVVTAIESNPESNRLQ